MSKSEHPQAQSIRQYKKQLKAIETQLLANVQYLATLGRSLMRTEIDETISDSFLVEHVQANLMNVVNEIDAFVHSTFIEEILDK